MGGESSDSDQTKPSFRSSQMSDLSKGNDFTHSIPSLRSNSRKLTHMFLMLCAVASLFQCAQAAAWTEGDVDAADFQEGDNVPARTRGVPDERMHRARTVCDEARARRDGQDALK